MRAADLGFILLVVALALLNAVLLAKRETTAPNSPPGVADSVRPPTLTTTHGGLQ